MLRAVDKTVLVYICRNYCFLKNTSWLADAKMWFYWGYTVAILVPLLKDSEVGI